MLFVNIVIDFIPLSSLKQFHYLTFSRLKTSALVYFTQVNASRFFSSWRDLSWESINHLIPLPIDLSHINSFESLEFYVECIF